MDLVAALIVFGSVLGVLSGVIMLLFRSRRQLGAKLMLGSAAAFVLGIVLINNVMNEQAREAGFESAADMQAAEDAGITDAATWAEERARQEQEIAAQRAAALAAEEAERAAEAAAQRAAEEAALEAEQRAEQERIAREEEDRRRGFHCLSVWDGSHRDFVAQITARLREPRSFEHISTRVTPVDESGLHFIFMEYRARNGFGGMNVSEASGFYRNADCVPTVIAVE